jgi:hypothetical protein
MEARIAATTIHHGDAFTRRLRARSRSNASRPAGVSIARSIAAPFGLPSLPMKPGSIEPAKHQPLVVR